MPDAPVLPAASIDRRPTPRSDWLPSQLVLVFLVLVWAKNAKSGFAPTIIKDKSERAARAPARTRTP